MESVNNVEADKICHDCGKEILFNEDLIENGVYLNYDNAGKTISIYKCNDCFEKNKSLTNFQECEVYSRVVGYIRPVQQWHKGKKQEFGERKEFSMPDGGSCC
jgi:ribonucleoside-triphosphate reductase